MVYVKALFPAFVLAKDENQLQRNLRLNGDASTQEETSGVYVGAGIAVLASCAI